MKNKYTRMIDKNESIKTEFQSNHKSRTVVTTAPLGMSKYEKMIVIF